MKAIVSLAFLMCAATAFADLSSSESNRLSTAATVVRELRAMPDKGIPEDTWNRAECVAVIPGVKKAAFILGGEFGKGVVSCRSGKTWSAPIFLELQKGSAGFAKMHDMLFENQSTPGGLKREALDGYAQKLGLDTKKFAQALDTHAHKAAVEADMTAARDAAITGTPSFVINGYYLVGAQPAARFRSVIDRALSEAAAPRAK